jgi:hypothetical protein
MYICVDSVRDTHVHEKMCVMCICVDSVRDTHIHEKICVMCICVDSVRDTHIHGKQEQESMPAEFLVSVVRKCILQDNITVNL